jgi:hypothetical protein
MDRTITIFYHWTSAIWGNQIPEHLEEELEAEANTRITKMLKEGFVSGELHAHLHTAVPGKATPEDGWEFNGWFAIKKTY